MLIGLLGWCPGCAMSDSGAGVQPSDAPQARVITSHLTTRALDAHDDELRPYLERRGDPNADRGRLQVYRTRWSAVQRAVAHQGTSHRDTFYGSRAFWHTGSKRGLNWAADFPGDLADPVYVDGRGNVSIDGDANADIEIGGDAIVHIFGDLNATLELKGVCEVVIAGQITNNATIICDGQLELFVAGDSNGVLGATGSATIIIDGNAGGVIQCGAPSTTLTITGDLTGQIPAPKGKDAVLNLRVDGYAPTEKMLDLATAGFIRVNATLGSSNAPPGLYPASATASARPIARWVVLQQSSGQ